MKIKELELNFIPKTIIEAILSKEENSYVNIEKIKENKYIIKLDCKRFGPFDWNDDFNPLRISKIEENRCFLIFNIELNDEILDISYKDKDNTILKSSNTRISKSKYLYLLNSSYKFNQLLLKSDFDNAEIIIQNFTSIFSELIDFQFLNLLKPDYIIFKLSDNLFQLPWNIFNYQFAKGNSITLFSVNPEIDFDFLYSLKINKYNLKNILFARDKNFEIDEKLWANKLNKILFSNQDQFLQVFQAMDIVAILSHGFRKKDFSSIKINNIFFNPYYLNELKKTPHIIFLLSCMMNYSNSDNNLINLLFKISTKLIFSTPYIIPLEYIESIFKILTIDEGNNQDIKISLFDLFIKILQTSFFSSSLFKILI